MSSEAATDSGVDANPVLAGPRRSDSCSIVIPVLPGS